MPHTTNLTKAERREQKNRLRMRVHGKSLKRASARAVRHIHKASKK